MPNKIALSKLHAVRQYLAGPVYRDVERNSTNAVQARTLLEEALKELEADNTKATDATVEAMKMERAHAILMLDEMIPQWPADAREALKSVRGRLKIGVHMSGFKTAKVKKVLDELEDDEDMARVIQGAVSNLKEKPFETFADRVRTRAEDLTRISARTTADLFEAQAREWQVIRDELLAKNSGPVTAYDVSTEHEKRIRARQEKLVTYEEYAAAKATLMSENPCAVIPLDDGDAAEEVSWPVGEGDELPSGLVAELQRFKADMHGYIKEAFKLGQEAGRVSGPGTPAITFDTMEERNAGAKILFEVKHHGEHFAGKTTHTCPPGTRAVYPDCNGCLKDFTIVNNKTGRTWWDDPPSDVVVPPATASCRCEEIVRSLAEEVGCVPPTCPVHGTDYVKPTTKEAHECVRCGQHASHFEVGVGKVCETKNCYEAYARGYKAGHEASELTKKPMFSRRRLEEALLDVYGLLPPERVKLVKPFAKEAVAAASKAIEERKEKKA